MRSFNMVAVHSYTDEKFELNFLLYTLLKGVFFFVQFRSMSVEIYLPRNQWNAWTS